MEHSPQHPEATAGMGVLPTVWRYEEIGRRVVLLSLLYCVPLQIISLPVTDPDVWWHLRTGQWIVEHGMVPTTDPFSIHGAGQPWVAYSWLVEILLYGLYTGIGLVGIALYQAVLCLLITWALHRFIRKRVPHFPYQIMLTLPGVLGLVPILNPRPLLFSILFFIVEVDLLLTARQTGDGRRLWLLPPLFVLWANIHIQFIYGLVALALAVVESLIMRIPGLTLQHSRPRTLPFAFLFGVLIACCAATLLTPYHTYLYQTIFELITQTVPFQYIRELSPLQFRNVGEWFVLATILGAAMALGRHWDGKPFLPMLLGLGILLACRATRDRWVAMVPALAVLAESGATRVAVAHFVLTKFRLGLVVTFVLVGILLGGRTRHFSEEKLNATMAEFYPVAAARFVEQQGYAGPIFNHFNWGGYLIWRLPCLPVSMDGRTNLYGDGLIERHFQTWFGRGPWMSDPALVSAKLIFIPQHGPLTSLLHLDLRFDLVYEDQIAAIFVPAAP